MRIGTGKYAGIYPKKTDMTTLAQTELDEIIEQINNTPLSVLGLRTPNKAFERELSKLEPMTLCCTPN